MALGVIAGPGMDIEEPLWELLIPDRPDGLSAPLREVAHREWVRVTAELRETQTLAAVNRHAVQRLVLAYVRYDAAAAMVMRDGAVVESPRTKVPQLNLWQVEMRQADSDATGAEMELCLSPRRRSAAGKVQRKVKRATAADTYLRGAGG
ncbi:P27 family phage terminase small subunit [Pseudoroseomonas cervicalis]|uniref:P27 family phage terminase small subunit n=1 Tax=Teichococcus cervicalis TaxID=204525 RepID=UPI0027884FC7|nr:P27 family phage terminase small subunit [Pseudoroseomonas cervicalis]MDQ1081434.1 P27 family predicted phage terminase small subunit [Pseudoroseomonas cervicalis]